MCVSKSSSPSSPDELLSHFLGDSGQMRWPGTSRAGGSTGGDTQDPEGFLGSMRRGQERGIRAGDRAPALSHGPGWGGQGELAFCVRAERRRQQCLQRGTVPRGGAGPTVHRGACLSASSLLPSIYTPSPRPAGPLAQPGPSAETPTPPELPRTGGRTEPAALLCPWALVRTQSQGSLLPVQGSARWFASRGTRRPHTRERPWTPGLGLAPTCTEPAAAQHKRGLSLTARPAGPSVPLGAAVAWPRGSSGPRPTVHPPERGDVGPPRCGRCPAGSCARGPRW